MVILGILVTVLGFLLSFLAVTMSGTTAELGIAVLGILVSLVGIIGLINQAYLRHAIWKK